MHNICSCFCEADIISVTTISPEMELLFGCVINDFSTKENMNLLLTGSSSAVAEFKYLVSCI